jgi:lactoylglutathione lyase
MPGMSHWRKDIGAITLFVEDLERTKLFYQEVSELQPGLEDDTDVMFHLENTLLFLTKSSEAPRMIAPGWPAVRTTGRGTCSPLSSMTSTRYARN